MNLLIIEDEEKLAKFTEDFFAKKGWSCVTVPGKEELADLLKTDLEIDIILLDLMLGREHGEDLLKMIRKNNKQVPIIVTTAVGQLSKKIELFNLGADDYLVKPFEIEELEVRIDSLMKKYKKIRKVRKTVIEIDSEFTLNLNSKSVCRKKGGATLAQLTGKEAELFKILLDSKGQVVDNDRIIQSVWHTKPGYQSNVITATLKRLKAKLKPIQLDEKIVTVKGVGIKFAGI